MSQITEFDAAKLPEGIRSGFVEGVTGLRMHVLEAGFDPPGRPRLLLLHGFPELAYSWRKVMGPLAAAGFHVIAPLVGGDHMESGRREGTHNLTPAVGELGKAVQQQEAWPARRIETGFQDVHP